MIAGEVERKIGVIGFVALVSIGEGRGREARGGVKGVSDVAAVMGGELTEGGKGKELEDVFIETDSEVGTGVEGEETGGEVEGVGVYCER